MQYYSAVCSAVKYDKLNQLFFKLILGWKWFSLDKCQETMSTTASAKFCIIITIYMSFFLLHAGCSNYIQGRLTHHFPSEWHRKQRRHHKDVHRQLWGWRITAYERCARSTQTTGPDSTRNITVEGANRTAGTHSHYIIMVYSLRKIVLISPPVSFRISKEICNWHVLFVSLFFSL